MRALAPRARNHFRTACRFRLYCTRTGAASLSTSAYRAPRCAPHPTAAPYMPPFPFLNIRAAYRVPVIPACFPFEGTFPYATPFEHAQPVFLPRPGLPMPALYAPFQYLKEDRPYYVHERYPYAQNSAPHVQVLQPLAHAQENDCPIPPPARHLLPNQQYPHIQWRHTPFSLAENDQPVLQDAHQVLSPYPR